MYTEESLYKNAMHINLLFSALLSNQNQQLDFQSVPAFQSEEHNENEYSIGSGLKPCSYYTKAYREKVDW